MEAEEDGPVGSGLAEQRALSSVTMGTGRPGLGGRGSVEPGPSPPAAP